MTPATLASRTATSAVLSFPRSFRPVETPVPDPSVGEVVIAVEGCGVCASSLPVWEGREWFEYPLPAGAPGHEAWGVVESTGEGVDLAEGTRVAFLSDQAFVTRAVVPVEHVVKLPGEIGHGPFPAEAIGCAMNAFRRSDVRPGQTVAVIGVGFLGALLCRLAADAGARVLAISRRPFALAVARRFGAAETFSLIDRQNAAREIQDRTGGRGCDRVIEAVGMQEPLDLATDLVAEGGRLVIAGYHQEGLRAINMQAWNWKGIDVVNAHERDPRVVLDGIRAAVEAVASARLDPTPLLTHRFPLHDLNSAFETLAARPDGFLKAVVVMR